LNLVIARHTVHTNMKMFAFFTTYLCTLLPICYFCQDYSVGTPIKYTNCGPNTLINVDMSPCKTLPCVFMKGTNATVTIDFNTTRQVNEITTKVFGIVAGIPIPYQLPKADGCDGCNLQCPLQPGTHKYVNVFPVLKEYPDIKLAVKWELVDKNENQLLCFVFPMEING